MRTLVLTAVVTLAAPAVFPSSAAARGGIAFHYRTPLTAHELAWYSRFDVLVTHDPLPRVQVDALHRAGTKLALYEWSVAYYASLATPWHHTLPPSALLNRAPLRGHAGAEDADAFYFDPASPEHERGRAEQLAKRLRAIGYDGVFLDTTTAENVHPRALAEYRLRHPDVDYDVAFARFLHALRGSVGVIVTNQGYRDAANFLPYADWDVSESLITYPRNGRFVLRPWNDPGDRWNSTSYLMRHLIAPAQRAYPRVRFAHINYVDDPRLAAELIAVSRLFGAGAVVAPPDLATPLESDLLFLDLGRAKPRIDTPGGAYRFFERGFIGINRGAKPLRVENEKTYVDAVTGARVRGTIVIPPNSATILRRAR
ncbi:MAG: hypothetical protein JO197_14555 [Acidobacteria bacterium]|nr:hypothetical protein [Acidobacteriota bacterium]MBV9478767.1 hypothetical protein [Acidobacteriota bacterium]